MESPKPKYCFSRWNIIYFRSIISIVSYIKDTANFNKFVIYKSTLLKKDKEEFGKRHIAKKNTCSEFDTCIHFEVPSECMNICASYLLCCSHWFTSGREHTWCFYAHCWNVNSALSLCIVCVLVCLWVCVCGSELIVVAQNSGVNSWSHLVALTFNQSSHHVFFPAILNTFIKATEAKLLNTNLSTTLPPSRSAIISPGRVL